MGGGSVLTQQYSQQGSLWDACPTEELEFDSQVQAIQEEIARFQEVKRMSSPFLQETNVADYPNLASYSFDCLTDTISDVFDFDDLTDLNAPVTTFEEAYIDSLSSPSRSPSPLASPLDISLDVTLDAVDATDRSSPPTLLLASAPLTPSTSKDKPALKRKRKTSPASRKRRRSAAPLMSAEELAHSISYVLPQENLPGVLDIVHGKQRRDDTKDLNIDIEMLDDATRERLASYVDKCLKDCIRKSKRRGSARGSMRAFKTSALFKVEEVLTIKSSDEEEDFIDIMN